MIAGISLKTQEMYGLVFLTRYIDIFFRFISLYVGTLVDQSLQLVWNLTTLMCFQIQYSNEAGLPGVISHDHILHEVPQSSSHHIRP